MSVDAERIRSALQSVLAGRSFRAAAANIASEMNNHISLDDLPLARLAGHGQER